MPYDPEIERRIDGLVEGTPGLAKKKMFGGICYLVGGNMCGGILKQSLIVRLGSAEKAAEAMAGEHVSPFDITGRAMKGWVMVAPEGYADDPALAAWLRQGIAFARSLPPK